MLSIHPLNQQLDEAKKECEKTKSKCEKTNIKYEEVEREKREVEREKREVERENREANERREGLERIYEAREKFNESISQRCAISRPLRIGDKVKVKDYWDEGKVGKITIIEKKFHENKDFEKIGGAEERLEIYTSYQILYEDGKNPHIIFRREHLKPKTKESLLSIQKDKLKHVEPTYQSEMAKTVKTHPFYQKEIKKRDNKIETLEKKLNKVKEMVSELVETASMKSFGEGRIRSIRYEINRLEVILQ